MRLLKTFGAAVAVIFLAVGRFGAASVQNPTRVQFAVPDAVQAHVWTVGTQDQVSLCAPAVTNASDLCGSPRGSTSPVGGNPPYHFQLDNMGGFPPMGLTLLANGRIAGTPRAAGDTVFRVCAVDLSGAFDCQPVTVHVVAPDKQPEQQKKPAAVAPPPADRAPAAAPGPAPTPPPPPAPVAANLACSERPAALQRLQDLNGAIAIDRQILGNLSPNGTPDQLSEAADRAENASDDWMIEARKHLVDKGLEELTKEGKKILIEPEEAGKFRDILKGLHVDDTAAGSILQTVQANGAASKAILDESALAYALKPYLDLSAATGAVSTGRGFLELSNSKGMFQIAFNGLTLAVTTAAAIDPASAPLVAAAGILNSTKGLLFNAYDGAKHEFEASRLNFLLNVPDDRLRDIATYSEKMRKDVAELTAVSAKVTALKNCDSTKLVQAPKAAKQPPAVQGAKKKGPNVGVLVGVLGAAAAGGLVLAAAVKPQQGCGVEPDMPSTFDPNYTALFQQYIADMGTWCRSCGFSGFSGGVCK